MDDTAIANLATLYRTLATDELRRYRAELEADRDRAHHSRRAAKFSLEFSTSRIDVITRVLAERGVREEEA